MILTLTQQHALLEAAKPLIRWLNENCHPHCIAYVDTGSVELVEGVARMVTDEFILD